MDSFLVLLLVTLPIPWIAKIIWPHQVKLPEVAITMVASLIVVSVVYFAGVAGVTHDNEIWNGHITSKDRKHGEYTRSYSCRCRQTCSGAGKDRTCYETCDTCYEDRYTVTWTARSTIGDFGIEHLDRGSRSVYKTPDPARFTEIKVGDPCSRSMPFTNYVKAVPESLFHANPLLAQRYAGKIPEYPGKIYDHYRINRVLSVGVNVPDLPAWNYALGHTLRELGPRKQANAIVLFVAGAEPDYQHALESAWIGGKKNDIIVIVGVNQWPKIDWVAVSSWSKAEMFKVGLRDDLQALGEVKMPEFMQLLHQHTLGSFERRHMKEFEYLKSEIDPPMWVMMLAAALGILISLGASYWFYKNDLE